MILWNKRLDLIEAEELYQEEYSLLTSNGVQCSLFDFDVLSFDEFRPKPAIENGDVVLYRGWMLSPELYQKLEGFVKSKGASLFTGLRDYIYCHHLPNWYETCLELTAESRFFPNDENLEKSINLLAWDEYFVKDFVKSNSTERGSIASSATEVSEIVSLINTYRGEIEGGIAVRRVEDYKKHSEVRYFVFNGKAYSSDDKIPEIVLDIAKRITAPFYSLDIVERHDGVLRLVEIGDGQVSDKKEWSISSFTSMLLENCEINT